MEYPGMDRRRGMRSGRPVLRSPLGSIPLFLAVLGALGGAEGSAQEIVITGAVIDALLGTPVPSPLVEILDADGAPIAAIRGGQGGLYRITSERTEIIRMRATGFGYAAVRRSFRVPEGESSFEVPFELDRAPIQIDPLTVNARRAGLTAGRILFDQHRALGKGTFFTGQEIWERDRSIKGILVGEEGMIIRPLPGGRSNETGSFVRDSLVLSSMAGRGKCLQVMIDGWYVQRQASDFLDMYDPMLGMMNDRSSAFENWLEEVTAGDVYGMELYAAYEDVPEDLRVEAYPCGMLILWQRGAWLGPGGG